MDGRQNLDFQFLFEVQGSAVGHGIDHDLIAKYLHVAHVPGIYQIRLPAGRFHGF
jgi:hypothetical protein